MITLQGPDLADMTTNHEVLEALINDAIVNWLSVNHSTTDHSREYLTSPIRLRGFDETLLAKNPWFAGEALFGMPYMVDQWVAQNPEAAARFAQQCEDSHGIVILENLHQRGTRLDNRSDVELLQLRFLYALAFEITKNEDLIPNHLPI